MAKKSARLFFSRPERQVQNLLESDEHYLERIAIQQELDFLMLETLALKRGIPEGPLMFKALALELARELYPETKPKGRKEKWGGLAIGYLAVEVERLLKPHGKHNISSACAELVERKPWCNLVDSRADAYSSSPAETLRQRYSKSKDLPWANVCRDAFRLHQKNETIAEWDKRVLDLIDD